MTADNESSITKKGKAPSTKIPPYPRSSLEKALRIPKSILEQNAGKDCSEEESAKYVGIKFNKGPYGVEISTSIKYGLLERPEAGKLRLQAGRGLQPRS